jgi:uncharacterized protein YbaR (Trm112 family)
MRIETIKKLCCPIDKEDLSLNVITKDTNGNILEGVLTCNFCRRYYPVVSGIPIMLPDAYREKQLETPLMEKWNVKLPNRNNNDFVMPENTL